MTCEEALSEVNKRISNMETTAIEWCATERAIIYKTIDFLKTAKKSIEKQISKKPIDDDGLYRCPICKESVEFEDFYYQPYSAVKFCVNCGQRLDWADIEE